MHIVAIVVAVLAGVGIWYWRLKSLHQAGSEVADIVGRARGAYRMRKFRDQVEASPLNNIDDPALAATVLLFALANEDKTSLHRADTLIRDQIAQIVPADDLDEILSYASWAAKSALDPRDLVRRFKPLWHEQLTGEEREELIGMAKRVAALSVPAVQSQSLTLETLQTAMRA